MGSAIFYSKLIYDNYLTLLEVICTCTLGLQSIYTVCILYKCIIYSCSRYLDLSLYTIMVTYSCSGSLIYHFFIYLLL